MQLHKCPMPPGLREFADTDNIPPPHVEKLREAYWSIRGKKPATVEDWRTLYGAVKKYLNPRLNFSR